MPVLKFKDPDTKAWKELTVVSDGVTFIPTIDANGNLSWSNNGHLDNPETINIYGKSFVNYTSITEFPAVGTENLLYIDTTTNIIYRWDTATNKYVNISNGGSGGDMSNYYTKSEVDSKFTNYTPVLKNKLTIGDKEFDGSAAVTIPVYNGDETNP